MCGVGHSLSAQALCPCRGQHFGHIKYRVVIALWDPARVDGVNFAVALGDVRLESASGDLHVLHASLLLFGISAYEQGHGQPGAEERLEDVDQQPGCACEALRSVGETRRWVGQSVGGGSVDRLEQPRRG